MSLQRRRLLGIVFTEMLASAVLERTLYFYTHARLGFSDTANLGLALAFGLVYIGAAVSSHAVAVRVGERRALVGCLLGLAGLHCIMALTGVVIAAGASNDVLAGGGLPGGGLPGAAAFVVLALGVAVCTGIKWPIIESYIGAGQSPAQAIRSVGWFCMTFSAAIPISVALSGPIIGSRAPWALFLLAAGMNLLALRLVWPLPATPPHLPEDHPARLPPARLERYRRLLRTSRWGLVGMYTMLFIIAPLLPGIFGKLGIPVNLATGLAAVLDFALFGSFVGLTLVTAWHNRPGPLVAALLALPTGFLLVLFGPAVGWVVLGEVVFGVASGMVYYASLYYALVVKNAAVDAGGHHEGLIGLGLVLGPVAGVTGLALGSAMGGYVPGMLSVVLPMIALGVVGGAWQLVGLPRGERPVDA